MIEEYMCECNGVCNLTIESEIYENIVLQKGVYIRHPKCLHLVEDGDTIIEQTDKYVLVRHESKNIE